MTGMYGEAMEKDMVCQEGTNIEGTTATTTSMMFYMSYYGSIWWWWDFMCVAVCMEMMKTIFIIVQ